MISEFAIEISDLQYAVTGNETIIRIKELLIEKRSIVTILGPSGCGKTTFLFLLSGLLSANKGSHIRLANSSVTDAVNSGLVSISFQTPVLMPWRTASQNVSLALELKGQSIQTQDMNNALDRVELNRNRHESYPEALSSGMRSRVAVAQAMVSHARILLMDEVFGTLDEATRVKMNVMLWLGYFCRVDPDDLRPHLDYCHKLIRDNAVEIRNLPADVTKRLSETGLMSKMELGPNSRILFHKEVVIRIHINSRDMHGSSTARHAER